MILQIPEKKYSLLRFSASSSANFLAMVTFSMSSPSTKLDCSSWQTSTAGTARQVLYQLIAESQWQEGQGVGRESLEIIDQLHKTAGLQRQWGVGYFMPGSWLPTLRLRKLQYYMITRLCACVCILYSDHAMFALACCQVNCPVAGPTQPKHCSESR